MQAKPTDSIRYVIFQAGGGYGYDVFVHDSKIIHQPSMPAMQGNQPFESEYHAKKTAELVLSKMRNGQFPPSITRKEMDNLLAIKPPAN